MELAQFLRTRYVISLSNSRNDASPTRRWFSRLATAREKKENGKERKKEETEEKATRNKLFEI